MEKYIVSGKNFCIEFQKEKNCAYISGGYFGEIKLSKAHFFMCEIKDLKTGKKQDISSLSNWESVLVEESGEYIRFSFSAPEGIRNIRILLSGEKYDDRIEWHTEVVNDNPDFSVMSVSYPTPSLNAPYFDLFVPINSGRVFKDAGNRGFSHDSNNEFVISMHYFAVYGKNSGIYIGTEDPDACVKRYRINAKDNSAEIRVDFFGIDGNKPENSFKIRGISKWQYFEGDWYDATLIYKDFVYKKASWLPEINEDGRPDTPRKFKEAPVWIYDYVPNSEYQRDNMPRTLAIRNYPDDYWYNAPIQLQKELNVPLVYHVYNWHKIPFNVEYPHFMPAKPEFIEKVKKLKENNIYVIPYINSVSWEADDKEMDHEVNFENTGKFGCAVKDDGTNWTFPYPQTTLSGKNVGLVQMCPSFDKWHEINFNTVRQMEKEIDIDGVYFDQVSACIGRPCYNPQHNHTTGGGSYWVDGYNKMMEKINSKKPKDSFYFSECVTEGYMKSFDGFLSWMWVASDEVPAYPAVYSGYIQIFGRLTGGKKADDVEFFKFQTAKSLLYGQQIGWCNADVIYNAEKLDFFKKIVKLRYDYKELFISSYMLRPPFVSSNLKPKYTEPNLRFKSEVEMAQVLSGAWKFKDQSKIVIFITNIASTEAGFELAFDANEYGIDSYTIPEEFNIINGKCKIKGTLAPTECKAWEFVKK
ncbi:MAG: hypothetical protein E7411_07875 [Ruminococcaceae bacterium]|nr:hypothetical protein [Oscillospiraceae bacterium]